MITLLRAGAALLSLSGFTLPVQTLDGQARVFPSDAAAPRSVFVVTFSKGAATQGQEWTRKLGDAQAKFNAPVFQVAILEDVPKMFRSSVVSAMGRDVPKELRDHFWIAVTGTKDWQHAVESTGKKEAQVFVLDGRAGIVWRAHGAVSDAKLAELAALPPP